MYFATYVLYLICLIGYTTNNNNGIMFASILKNKLSGAATQREQVISLLYTICALATNG